MTRKEMEKVAEKKAEEAARKIFQEMLADGKCDYTFYYNKFWEFFYREYNKFAIDRFFEEEQMTS